MSSPDDDKKDPLAAEVLAPPPAPEQARERQLEVIRLREKGDDEGDALFPLGGRPGQIIAAFTGPLPPPAVLKEYEKVVPGLAKRLVDTLEAESKHRREEESLDRKTNREIALKESVYQGRGMNYALAVSILGFGTAIVFGALKLEVGGAILGSINLVGLASVFIIGRRRQRPDSDGDRDG